MRRIALVEEPAGKSRFALSASNRARRGELALPLGSAAALSGTNAVTVQLHISDACVSARLDDVIVQESNRFEIR